MKNSRKKFQKRERKKNITWDYINTIPNVSFSLSFIIVSIRHSRAQTHSLNENVPDARFRDVCVRCGISTFFLKCCSYASISPFYPPFV